MKEINICAICEDASEDCQCFNEDEDPRDNPLIGDDDWIHDVDMGAK